MEALQVRPQGRHQPQRQVHRGAHRPAHHAGHRAAAGGPAAADAPAHAAHAPAHPARAPAHAAAPASPGDLAALQQQASFDAIASARAEQQREMNALRDLAMQQVKRDDQVMNEWIKLI